MRCGNHIHFVRTGIIVCIKSRLPVILAEVLYLVKNQDIFYLIEMKLQNFRVLYQ